MKVVIKKSNLEGVVSVPPSKSLSHRAIIAASLAKGTSKISNIIYSQDVYATIGAMEACGAVIEKHEDFLIIHGSKVKRVEKVINAKESGSTIRFMIPIALTCNEEITFVGENNLVNRPLDSYFEIFDIQGIAYEKKEKSLPLTVKNGLHSGIFHIKGDISSQFITGLLYALPLLPGDSKIVITTNLESKGYIDLTLAVLKKFGIQIINHNYEVFEISGNQEYKPTNYVVEGDFSQSAFWLVAGTLGANIQLANMNKDSYQGDKKIIQDINDMSGEVYFKEEFLIASKKSTKGTVIDFSQSPDLGPALTVLAALSEGKTTFINASRLRIKECDRITCMRVELEKMGAMIEESEDKMIIEGIKEFQGNVTLDSHNDHRLAMAFAIASLKTNGSITIENAMAVQKSYPHFFKDFERLGGEVSYED